MPGDKVCSHNGETVEFNEREHTYVDSKNRLYTSVTTLVGLGFSAFDAEKVAKASSVDDWSSLIDKWDREAKKAAWLGTRLHENCENVILGNLDKLHSPTTVDEKACMDAAMREAKRLKADKTIESLEPEKLVFSSTLMLAGSVDLLAKNRNGSYTIYDWKRVKKLSTSGYKGQTGILEATKDIQDSNYWHYALQLRLYEIILKLEGYVPREAPFRRCLNVITNGKLTVVDLPDVGEEAKKLIVWHKTVNNKKMEKIIDEVRHN
jgi:ATP-dependent exoDNAse (exonuclease V) beta subunit